MRWFSHTFFGISVFVVTGVLLICGTAPVRWHYKADSPWRVAVLDKTVPHPDYREHGALYWVLRHDKIASPRGARDWRLDQHYVGFRPRPDRPEEGKGTDLAATDLANAHLLFLADTYGVYEGDYLSDEERAGLDYSPRIYGGLSRAEAELVGEFAGAGGHVIAEFNTFASPTPPAARRVMEELLGVRWSGWTGRHFRDLGEESEVPRWARRQYREQYAEPWSFAGPGYLLVHEDSTLFVLREDLDIRRNGLRIHVRAGGAMMDGLLDGTHFNYWFDIVAPAPGAETPAAFRLDVLDSGRAQLERFGVPAEFPAVVVSSRQPLRAYFAGDFSDAGGSLGPHWLEGLPWLNKTLLSLWFPRTADQEPFYWGFYIPLLRNVFAAIEPTATPPALPGRTAGQ